MTPREWPVVEDCMAVDKGVVVLARFQPGTGPELVTPTGQPFEPAGVHVFWAAAGMDDDGVQRWELTVQVLDGEGIVRRVHRAAFPQWLTRVLDRLEILPQPPAPRGAAR